LNAGCDCTIANVAIAIGINHPFVNDLRMDLIAPDDDGVLLVAFPPSGATLVPGNKITFDDSGVAQDPQTLGSDVDGSGNTLAGTYFAQGDFSNDIGANYPDPRGLGKFNGETLPSVVSWTFVVADFFPGDSGTIESVELTIECAE